MTANLTKQADGKVPKTYIRCIATLETAMLEAINKQKVTPKKMNAINTRGLNAVRQKIRKNNKEFTKELEAYRENADAFMAEDEDEEEAPVTAKSKRQRLDAGYIAGSADDEGFTVVGAGGKAVLYTPDSILKHLRTISEARGRRSTDRAEQVRIMERLLEVAATDYQRIRVLVALVSSRFDAASNGTNPMTQESWKAAESEISTLLGILEKNKSMVVVEGAEEWEDDEKHPEISKDSLFKIPGSVISFIERLDDELTRALQAIDPHTGEYVERLSDESSLYSNIVRTLIYAESLRERLSEVPQEVLNRIVIRRLEHLYFKVGSETNETCGWLTCLSLLKLSVSRRRKPGNRSPRHST